MYLRLSFIAALLIFLFLFAAPFSVFAEPEQYSLFKEQAAKIAAAMDDKTLASQVLLTGIDGRESLTPAMRNLLERIPAGGIMLFKYNLDSPKEKVKKMLSETSALVRAGAGVAPFMAVDHEGGLVHRFGPGVERLPSAYSFWELAQRDGVDAAILSAETIYARSALEIRDLGISMVLGPVAETLNKENRLFLETRSYGSEAGFVCEAASAFLKGMEAAGIACALKHFPGNSAKDPHSGVSSLDAGKETLDEMVKPFAEIIHSLNPAFVLLSHVMVPALDDSRNASLSGRIIKDWLRGELGFNGIVLADDFEMGAVTALGINPAEAAVEALNAGVDMIMVWPLNIARVHASIVKALEEGKLSRGRLLEAAERIIAEKLRYGLIDNRIDNQYE